MSVDIGSMIEIKRGQIQNAPKKHQADAIVNCAKPTLMGSNSNVDGAIHTAIDNKNGRTGFFKEKIKEQFADALHTADKEDVLRCSRGDAVITEGYGLCKYVIHTVGPESDRNTGKWNGVYSSSCVKKLMDCYQNIMKIVFEYPEIEKIAIPVIASGNYGFDFEYAFTIGLTTVYNAILEKKKKQGELFKYIGLKKIYFIVPDEKGNYATACDVYKRYQKTFQKEHKAVARGVWKSQEEFWKEISLYDNQKGYFAVAKIVRQMLIVFRIVFGFWTYLKDCISKEDWVIRRQTVEIIAFIKMIIPIPLMWIAVQYQSILAVNKVIMCIIVYNLLDTVTYLLSLMFLADIQRPSANVSRSLVMLVVNYIEVEFDVACIWMLLCNMKNLI